jgi:hypothetical protein
MKVCCPTPTLFLQYRWLWRSPVRTALPLLLLLDLLLSSLLKGCSLSLLSHRAAHYWTAPWLAQPKVKYPSIQISLSLSFFLLCLPPFSISQASELLPCFSWQLMPATKPSKSAAKSASDLTAANTQQPPTARSSSSSTLLLAHHLAASVSFV